VRAIQERQGMKIACIEEVAFRKGFISSTQLQDLSREYGNNEFGTYINSILEER
jgi:glucose-1-phosphate thymidylyltransferase